MVTLEDVRRIPSVTFVVITTPGLPMTEPDFTAWQSARDGRTVMDLCAAHALTDPERCGKGVEARNLYAARTVESVRRAERQLIESLERGCAPEAPGGDHGAGGSRFTRTG